MKTSAPALARPSTASRAPLRRLAAVGLLAPVVALAACSGGSAVTADSTAQAAGTPAATGGSTAATSTTSATSATSTSKAPVAPATTAAGLPTDQPVVTAVKATIKDASLGHTITATRVTRRLPWPAGQPVGAKQFEIVGVMVTVTAGSRYSASVAPSMLSLVAASPAQTVPPTVEFGSGWRTTPLKAAGRSQTTTGWVFFKVNRGTTSTLRLAFARPAYQVSTTGAKIPAQTTSVVLTK